MNWKPRIGYWGLVVLLSLLLVACASQQEIRLPDQFETETLVDGSKRFSFVLNFAPRFGGAGQADGEGRQQEGQPQRAPTGRAGGTPQRVPSRAEMDQVLEEYFQRYPYCEEGYFVYDQGFDGSRYTMLGECQESATL